MGTQNISLGLTASCEQDTIVSPPTDLALRCTFPINKSTTIVNGQWTVQTKIIHSQICGRNQQRKYQAGETS